MKLPLLLFLVLFLLLPFSVFAEQGCFLYLDSPEYCQVISKELATEECLLFNRCEVKEVFVRDTCSSREECRKIICKSSCRNEFAGRCPAGEAPDTQWCTPGCCQFAYGEKTFCSSVQSKSRCIVEVQNRDVTEYRFTALDTVLCQQYCAEKKLLPGEEQTLLEKQGPETAENEEVTDLAEKAEKKEEETTKKEEASFTSGLFWILLLLAVGFAFLFQLLWKRAHRFLPQEEAKKQAKKPWYTPFPSSEKVRVRIETAKQHQQQKVKKHQREEFLVEAGLLPEKPKEDLFKQLQKVVKKKGPEKSPLQALEEWGKK